MRRVALPLIAHHFATVVSGSGGADSYIEPSHRRGLAVAFVVVIPVVVLVDGIDECPRHRVRSYLPILSLPSPLNYCVRGRAPDKFRGTILRRVPRCSRLSELRKDQGCFPLDIVIRFTRLCPRDSSPIRIRWAKNCTKFSALSPFLFRARTFSGMKVADR